MHYILSFIILNSIINPYDESITKLSSFLPKIPIFMDIYRIKLKKLEIENVYINNSKKVNIF